VPGSPGRRSDPSDTSTVNPRRRSMDMDPMGADSSEKYSEDERRCRDSVAASSGDGLIPAEILVLTVE
jgi:hypothetical protein